MKQNQANHLPIYGELHLAATDGNFDTIKRLCNKQNVNNTAGEQRFTLLHCIALENRDKDIVSYLLNISGCDINKKDANGNTPLFVAALAGHEKLVEFFLLNNAEVDQSLFDKYAEHFKTQKPKIFKVLKNFLQAKEECGQKNSSYGWNFWESVSSFCFGSQHSKDLGRTAMEMKKKIN